MPDLNSVRAETLRGMTRELTSPSVPDPQLPGIAEFLNSLAADMADCRRFNVGESEPALNYDPEVAS